MDDNKRLRAFIGRRIGEAADLAGMKQRELAERLGIQPNALSMVITGRNSITVERLVDIARVTGRELSFFLPGTATPDVMAALQAAYPGITQAQLLQVVNFAGYLRSPASRVPGGGLDTLPQGETSSANTERTTR